MESPASRTRGSLLTLFVCIIWPRPRHKLVVILQITAGLDLQHGNYGMKRMNPLRALIWITVIMSRSFWSSSKVFLCIGCMQISLATELIIIRVQKLKQKLNKMNGIDTPLGETFFVMRNNVRAFFKNFKNSWVKHELFYGIDRPFRGMEDWYYVRTVYFDKVEFSSFRWWKSVFQRTIAKPHHSI